MIRTFKSFFAATILALSGQTMSAQGWQENYGGVMLQGFSWDSFVDTQWTNLTSQADELSEYFNLIWIPQSGNCNSSYNQMGYTPVFYFDHNSSFGTENQLRTMIKTFKEKGTGIIADVVINHRNNLGVNGSWVDYPAETYNGTVNQMQPTDICANDDDGATYNWAKKNGMSISQNNDTGEGWNGCRDLDHKSANVQKDIKAYLEFLLKDLGYTGFRYDMVKGFSASFIGDYNTAAQPQFSVGEYWDSNDKIKAWINGTQKQSGAFDFQFRYKVRDAANTGNWRTLRNVTNATLIGSDGYARYAVTFVENHDMQDRGTTSGYTPDPIRRDTLAANAFLLAMPGTPCVFLPHWKVYKQDIKAMIDARELAGITNQSTYEEASNTSSTTVYANTVHGTKGNLMVVVGRTADYVPDGAQWVKILSGQNFTYYLSASTETAWADKASGIYSNAIDVRLCAVSAVSGTRIVYTLDGSEPTANSEKAVHGSTIVIDGTCTLKAALLVNGKVSGTVTRHYTIQPFEVHTATVWLKNPKWTTPVCFYSWANDGKNTKLLGNWPGTEIVEKKTIDGTEYYYRTFDIPSPGYSFNIIFNQGSGKSQTVDIGPIDKDVYYEIAEMVNGKYTVNDITPTVTGIDRPIVDQKPRPNHVYSLDGRLLRSGTTSLEGLPKGIYIVNSNKVIK